MGANPAAEVVGEEPLPGKANYLVGDRSRWRTDVPLYGRVRYADVYPGVSLTYYGDQRRLEYDLEIAPEADPRQIRFRIDGARAIRLDDEGRLRIRTKTGELVQHAPVVYQMKDGVREPVAARFRRFGKREIGFTVASYDRTRPLVIDPKIDFSTYLGGSLGDEAADVALAGNLDVYVVGTTSSTDFRPTLQAPRPVVGLVPSTTSSSSSCASDGSSLSVVYATYLGGNADDFGRGIALESDGKAVVVAQTNSSDIHQTNTFGVRGGNDVWVARLNSAGNGIEYAALVGGDKSDEPTGIAVDGARNAYIVGRTLSGNFPLAGSTPPPIQTSLKGPQDAFFSVLVADGTSMTYSTYMGGGLKDEANGIVVRPGLAYIVGTTDSDDFPTRNPLQPAIGGGAAGTNDAFLARFEPAGSSMDLRFSTYLGGKHADAGLGVTADSSGVYLTGTSASVDTFPRQNPYQGTYGGGSTDAFVTKLRLDGSVIVYSTFLGGSDADVGSGVEVDALGYAYVTGTTFSLNFPVRRPLPPPLDKLQPPSDAFLAKLTPNGCTLDYSTFFGGKTDDSAAAVAVTPSGSAVVVGRTNSSADFPQVFPLTAGYQGGVSDAFAALINDGEPPADLEVRKTASPSPAIVGGTLTYTVTVRNLSTTRPAYDVVLQDTLPTEVAFVSSTPGSPTCTFASPGPHLQLLLRPPPGADHGDDRRDRAARRFPLDLQPGADLRARGPDPCEQRLPPQHDGHQPRRHRGPQERTAHRERRPEDRLQRHGDQPRARAGHHHRDDGHASSGNDVRPGRASLPVPRGGRPHVHDHQPRPELLRDFHGHGPRHLGGRRDQPRECHRHGGGHRAREQQRQRDDHRGRAPGRGAVLHRALFEQREPAGVEEPRARDPRPRSPSTGRPPPATARSRRLLRPARRIHVGSLRERCARLVPGHAASRTASPTATRSSWTSAATERSPPRRFNRGRPFDSVTGKVRWEFNIGTSSLAPIGNGIGIVHSVANDANLYAMVKGAALAGGLGGGKWPTGYIPYPISGPSQGRPGSIPLSPGPPNRGTFLSSDDGRVYAIDSDHGSGGTALWISPVAGGRGPRSWRRLRARSRSSEPPATSSTWAPGIRRAASSSAFGSRTGSPGPPRAGP